MSPRDAAQFQADVIKGRRKAEEMLKEGIEDYREDLGEEITDEVWYDLVVAIAFTILQVNEPLAVEIAQEFCRTQIGSIPYDLQGQLGTKEWVQ